MIQIDIPMPEACDVCPFNRDFCYCYALDDDDWVKYRNDWEENVCERRTRPEYCPLKEQPEIIQCRECKYAAQDMICTHEHEWGNEVSRNHCDQNWFCADGKRRQKDD